MRTAQSVALTIAGGLMIGPGAVALGVEPMATTSARERSIAERIDPLIRDYRWDEAIASYRTALDRNENDAESWRGLGRVLRWQGRLLESRQAYQRAVALEPDDVEASLGIAASYRYDRDYGRARGAYDAVLKKWPTDADARQEEFQFTRDANPRLHVFYEDDLSFRAHQIGVGIPFGAREEVYFERGEEERPNAYVRTDLKGAYQHHFGVNHVAEFSIREADYEYPRAITDFAAIDDFVEYRLRYSRPVRPEHVATVRYTYRPTTLQVSGDEFVSHKLEADVRSQWTPRLAVTLGTGVLRDLDGSAQNVSDQRTTALVRAAVDYALTIRTQLSAGYITNPDLDNTIDSTRLLAVSYQWTEAWSSLLRYRFDDYKEGADQEAWYAGARFAPGGHLWAEAGIKTASRGDRNGTYPLVSVIYRF